MLLSFRWGGNYWVLGGDVNGGQILGKYPSRLTEAGAEVLDRGRVMPTKSWEAVWNALALWFGVSADNLDTVCSHCGTMERASEYAVAAAQEKVAVHCAQVLPNRANFFPDGLLWRTQLFGKRPASSGKPHTYRLCSFSKRIHAAYGSSAYLQRNLLATYRLK